MHITPSASRLRIKFIALLFPSPSSSFSPPSPSSPLDLSSSSHTSSALLILLVVHVFAIMPSLRRTFSSPSARSTPYPSSLGIASVRGGHGPRRSSGSDVSTRRVLADIDWWRVADGQREPESDPEVNENEETEATTLNAPQNSPRSPADTIADALADFALVAGPATIAAELALQQPSTSGPSEELSENQPGDFIVHVRVLTCSILELPHLSLFAPV